MEPLAGASDELNYQPPVSARGTPAADREVRGRADGPPTILIVDDVADNLMALEAMLRRDDVEIVTAGSGAAALEILLARPVALAIIDVQMPSMDGFALAELMRGVEKTRYVPIVFVTAGSRDQARVFKGYESGAVDFLYKPVDAMILRGKVDVFVTLERHRLQLQEEGRMREIFVGILGHDLRNPLNAVLLAAHMAVSRSKDEDVREPLNRVLKSGARMALMIEQLLDFTRLRRGSGIALSLKPIDLRQLVSDVLIEFESERLRIHVEVHGDTTGSWDPERILQVASNLVGNATQNSPSQIQIRIDGGADDDVTLQVHNGGPPIPDELRHVLFEPFRGATVGRYGKGVGLGLYITHQLVRAHGGTISFDSSADTGTRFVVRLPRHARVEH